MIVPGLGRIKYPMELEGETPEGVLWSDAATEPDWEAVYRAQLPRIYNYFRYRLADETLAEDLTSRTFEKAWRARHRYRRDIAGFGTWLLAIARNVAVDHFRSRREYGELEQAAGVAAGATPEDDGERASDLERLGKLLAGLPERDRELLALKYGAETTNRDIAKVMNLSESNVGTRLHRIVQALRREW